MSSNTTSSTTQSGGVGFTGLLAVAFIVLKLCHVITWSWFWVLSPIWISAAIAIVVIAVLLVILVVTDR